MKATKVKNLTSTFESKELKKCELRKEEPKELPKRNWSAAAQVYQVIKTRSKVKTQSSNFKKVRENAAGNSND